MRLAIQMNKINALINTLRHTNLRTMKANLPSYKERFMKA